MCDIKHFGLSMFLIFFLVTACSRNALTDAVGSGLTPNGMISRHELRYTFVRQPRMKTLQDVCDAIYFEGDMLCFSFTVASAPGPSTVEVWFLLPNGQQRVKAERLEFSSSRVYGFSLVGSLLERYFHDRLSQPAVLLGEHLHVPCSVMLELAGTSVPLQRTLSCDFSIDLVEAH